MDLTDKFIVDSIVGKVSTMLSENIAELISDALKKEILEAQKYHIDKVKKYTIKVICPSGIFDTSHWHRFHKVEVLIEQLGYRITKSNWRDNTITYYGKYIRFKQDYVKYINRK